MTSVTFYERGNQIVGFEIEGHAGYSKHGTDIVCAAISTASQMALLGIQHFAKSNVQIKIDEARAKIYCMLCDEASTPPIVALVVALQLTLRDISNSYPDYVTFHQIDLGGLQ